MFVNFSGEAKPEERTKMFFDRTGKTLIIGTIIGRKKQDEILKAKFYILVPTVKWTNTGWYRYDLTVYKEI